MPQCIPHATNAATPFPGRPEAAGPKFSVLQSLHQPFVIRASLPPQVMAITLAICGFTWALCYATLAAVGRVAALLPGLAADRPHLVAVASLGATIMMARSPASAIAVLKEVDGKGALVGSILLHCWLPWGADASGGSWQLLPSPVCPACMRQGATASVFFGGGGHHFTYVLLR